MTELTHMSTTETPSEPGWYWMTFQVGFGLTDNNQNVEETFAVLVTKENGEMIVETIGSERRLFAKDVRATWERIPGQPKRKAS